MSDITRKDYHEQGTKRVAPRHSKRFICGHEQWDDSALNKNGFNRHENKKPETRPVSTYFLTDICTL
jgi:hypothetical protein